MYIHQFVLMKEIQIDFLILYKVYHEVLLINIIDMNYMNWVLMKILMMYNQLKNVNEWMLQMNLMKTFRRLNEDQED